MNRPATTMMSIGASLCFMCNAISAIAQQADTAAPVEAESVATPEATPVATPAATPAGVPMATPAAKPASKPTEDPESGQLFYRKPKPAAPSVVPGEIYQANASKAGYTASSPAAPYPYPAQAQPAYQSSGQSSQYYPSSTSYGYGQSSYTGTQSLAMNGQYQAPAAQNQCMTPSQVGTSYSGNQPRAGWAPYNGQAAHSYGQNNYSGDYSQSPTLTLPQSSMSLYDQQEKALEDADRLNMQHDSSFSQPMQPAAQSTPPASSRPSFLGQLARQTAMMCLPMATGALIGGAMARAATPTPMMGSPMSGYPMGMPFGGSGLGGGGMSRLFNGLR
jgi:hypothetical protein